MTKISSGERYLILFLVLLLGSLIFVWRLGETGLIDETPPLFAAAGRAMAKTGDWLTPRVNGLPRYDKPPLFYWLIGIFYSFPGRLIWDPLGTWAARLPSALSSIALMIGLSDTLLRWPIKGDPFPRLSAFSVSLTFGMSPLVIIWGRTSVSDSLFCSLLGLSLLFHWRRFVDPCNERWWIPWVLLGFAVLAKGPVAVIITLLVFIFFALIRFDSATIYNRLMPFKGIFLTLLISLPWYLAELFVEGLPFWQSFFGYHNFQRFTSVVNGHSQPWWFFGPVMMIAAIPFSVFLIISLGQTKFKRTNPEDSLHQFAVCWLFAVFIFFTSAATKLPSYWLPAIPAASILIIFSIIKGGKTERFGWLLSGLLAILLAIAFGLSQFWIPLLKDPEMPNLSVELLQTNLSLKASLIFCFCTLICFNWFIRNGIFKVLFVQIILIICHLLVVLPLVKLGDDLRQLPIRIIAKELIKYKKDNEPLAMVGAMKPSLHFYTENIIFFEGRSDTALVNLADRLSHERRIGMQVKTSTVSDPSKSLLLVIDTKTSDRSYWNNLNPHVIKQVGIYKIWRLDRYQLERRANELKALGKKINWRDPRPERF